MTRRDAGLVIAGALGATVISLLLVVSVLARSGSGRPSVVVGRQPVPTAQPLAAIERRIPAEFRALLAPLLPLERGVADLGREAGTLLLLIVASGGAFVLARDQVVRIRASSAGAAGEQLRTLGVGLGVLIAVASTTVLAVFVLLRGVIALAPANIPLGLQALLSLLSVAAAALALAALLGFTATAWRFGTWLFGLEPWRALGERVPAGMATFVAVALMFLLAQVPIVGRVEAAVVLAYSLGAFVRARLSRTEARLA
jgi:hypothetical protein